MLSSWTFGRKIATGFAITAIALVVISITGYRSAKSLIRNDDLLRHSQIVRREIRELEIAALDAETGQRGFVITGQDTYLEPYRGALTRIDSVFRQLHDELADNPVQQQRLAALRTIIDAKLAELKLTIETRIASGFEPTQQIVLGGTGKRQMDDFRAGLAEMDHDEDVLLEQRRVDAEDATAVTTSVILWGSIGALIVTVLVGWLITTSLSKQVGSAVRHMQSSSTELQAAANQQASGSREQATAMQEIATTINELLATSRQIADSAQRVSQIAAQTTSTARAGDLTVTRGNDATSTVRRQIDLVVTHMLELGKKSQQVGSVLDIVAELAEQTNILAINATIEAAGAGESGRRFGVVADEIRKLADRVAISTKEIRGMVDEVRSAVNTTVMATEAGSKAVDAGATQVGAMATAFRDIASLVATTTDAAREIELSTKQQATAVEQVNVAITNVAQAARETETSASQTLQTSSQLTALSTDMLRLVQARVS